MQTTVKKPTKAQIKAWAASEEWAQQVVKNMVDPNDEDLKMELILQKWEEMANANEPEPTEQEPEQNDSLKFNELTGEINENDDPFAGLEEDVMPTGTVFHQFKEPGDTFSGIYKGPSNDFEGLEFIPYPEVKDGKDHVVSNFKAIADAVEATKNDPAWDIEKTVFRFIFNEKKPLSKNKAHTFADFTIKRYKLPS